MEIKLKYLLLINLFQLGVLHCIVLERSCGIDETSLKMSKQVFAEALVPFNKNLLSY